MRRVTGLACGALVLLGAWAAPASARWVVGVGIGIGVPVYAGPRYYYPYYSYYPYYPAPVVVQPAYPPPVVVQSAPAPASAVPAPAPTAPAAPELVPPPTLKPVATDRSADIDRRVQHLSNPDAQARADAAIELGRMKAERAVDALTTMLGGDNSATVREASARALGLIGSARALPALQRAAQADADRDVRNSARFAAEVIQANR
jgi:hypothetical protein